MNQQPAYNYASIAVGRINALQASGVAARKAGLLFEAIEALTNAYEAAKNYGDLLLTATTLRELGSAYQALYNRRYRIESAEDRSVTQFSDDGKSISLAIYKRADECYGQSIKILELLQDNTIQKKDREAERTAVTERMVAVSQRALLHYQRAQTYIFSSRRLIRLTSRDDTRQVARYFEQHGSEAHKVHNLERVLRTTLWFQRPAYLLRALRSVLSRDSETRGELTTILAAAFGDRVALYFEMAQYADENIYGKTPPSHWSLD